MLNKKEKILHAALTLFAEHGFAATSTNKVAKAAGVSEGLIFRHYENKEGLLNAIMSLAKEMAYREYADILYRPDPKQVIKGILEMPFKINEEHYHLWRLIYSLKWQTESYDNSMSEPVKLALINAFDKLNYDDPIAEAEAILIQIDGIAAAVLLRKPKNLGDILTTLLSKYNL